MHSDISQKALLIGALVLFAGHASAQWAPAPAFPSARTHTAAIRQGSTILTIGGSPWVNGNDMEGSVYTLADGAGSWVETAPLDGMGNVIGQGAGIDAAGRIVFFGGERDNGASGTTRVYTVLGGPSTTLPLRPNTAPDRYFAWCTDAQGRIYSIGGGKGREAVPGEGNTNLCWRYVSTSNTWEAIVPMPQGVGDACAVYDGNGHILVLGGVLANGGARSSNVARFDIATNSWSDTAIADMPVAINGARAVVGSNGWVYLMGGEGGPLLEPTKLSTTYIYRPDLNAWSAGPIMSTGRRYHAAVLGADDFVYVLGGENGVGAASCERLYAAPCATITTQPQSVEVWNGQAASFHTSVAGGAPMTLQWSWNGTPLSDGSLPGGATVTGSTTSDLSISNVNGAIVGSYTLSATNACGSTTSTPAQLGVLQPPSIAGQWLVRNLHTTWAEQSYGAGTSGGMQVGHGVQDVPPYLNLDQATVWNGSAESGAISTGPSSVGGSFSAIQDGLMVGWWWWPYTCFISGQSQTCYTRQACAVDPDGTFRNIQVSGWEYSQALATDGVEIVGTASTDDGSGNMYYSPVLWRRTASGSFTWWHLPVPSGAHGGASAVYDGKQYGGYWNAGVQFDGYHPCVWSGPGSTPVDLEPPGATSASITCADLGQQGGAVDSHATLWGNSANSTQDIHPAGYLSSSISDAHIGVQVGSAESATGSHAGIWAGSALSFVDLHTYLPSSFTTSRATGVEVRAPGRIDVIGDGHNSATGRNEALLWSLVIPSGSTGVAYCFGDGTSQTCPCGNGSAAGASSGCLNSLGSGGHLAATGAGSLSNDTLVLNGSSMPSAGGGLYFQGTQVVAGGFGSAFGDGLLCVAGSVVRLGVKMSVAGQSSYPESGDSSASSQGGVTSVGQRTYQVWYRDSASFCSSATFNLTNALEVLWTP